MMQIKRAHKSVKKLVAATCISAACGMNVDDMFHQNRRLWVRLHEKGGKFHEMPCHHTLEGYLTDYLERAQLADAGRVPLFQAFKCRPRSRRRARWRRMRPRAH